MSGTDRHFSHLLVSGGAGFIGSNFVRWMLARDPNIRITVVDKLTYAGNLGNFDGMKGGDRLRFVQADIVDAVAMDEAASTTDASVNFAAESHVDRSIGDADSFIRTNVLGTQVLLEAARRHGHRLFMQVSTDEVYGSVPVGTTDEEGALRPRSPYAASKASADLIALAHVATYGTPVIVSRAGNNFGPYQYPEKLIPLFITNAIDGEFLPLYGDGLHRRQWLFVEDHCSALDLLMRSGNTGEIYNVGGDDERTNRELTLQILGLLEAPTSLVRHIEDRPGHDRRYAMDSSKVRALGWRPARPLEACIASTVEWYRQHEDWWRPLKAGTAFHDYYRDLYAERLATGRPLE